MRRGAHLAPLVLLASLTRPPSASAETGASPTQGTLRRGGDDAGAPRPPRGVAPSGYVQVDLVPWRQSSADEVDPSTGEPLNRQGFSLRRARARLDGWFDAVEGAVELDLTTVPEPAVRPVVVYAGVSASDGDLGARATAGLVRIPFGADLLENNLEKLQLERATATDALFPGGYDLGALLEGRYRGARVILAAMNGAPIGDRWFRGRDPTESLDVLSRIALDERLGGPLGIDGGVSILYGRGLHPGTPPTKDTLVWRDVNENGIVELTEVQAIAGSAATPSEDFERFAVGADLALEVDVPWAGRLRLFGEGVLGKNLDRGLVVADPIARGRDLRELGWAVGARQELTEHAEVGARYDEYDPDLDASEIESFEVVPVDATFSTLAVTAAGRWKTARLILEYAHRGNALGRAADGRPTTLEDDSIGLRAEVSFP